MITTKKTISELNQDYHLDDVTILWTGRTVQLTLNGEILTTLTATVDVVDKITRWCSKNSYRCTQIHDGKIWL